MSKPNKEGVARIAQRSGLDASATAALIVMDPASEAEARQLASLLSPDVQRVYGNTPDQRHTMGPGAQFVASDAYQRLRIAGDGVRTPIGRGDMAVPLAGGPGTVIDSGATMHAQASLSFPGVREPRRFTSIEPTYTRVPGLVTVVDDVEGEVVHVVHETGRAAAAGGHPRGADLLVAHVTLAGSDKILGRWGTGATVSVDALGDPGNARQVFDLFTRGVSMRALEADMLHGDGSDNGVVKQLVGVTNTPGVPTVTRDSVGGETRVAAIVRGASTVLGAEYSGPLAAVLHPTDLEALTLEEEAGGGRARELLDLAGVGELAPSARATQGQVIVAAWRAAATLYLKGPFTLLVWNEHEDYVARRLVLLELSTFAEFDVHPSGFCIVNL